MSTLQDVDKQAIGLLLLLLLLLLRETRGALSPDLQVTIVHEHVASMSLDLLSFVI